jgi:hypothetical protein
MQLDRIRVLKIDKDCFPDSKWVREYVRWAVSICRYYGATVIRIRACESRRKGVHYYIEITPPITAEVANMLQYLLGDDCERADHNRARIDRGLNEWNKLFERVGSVLRTIYRNSGSSRMDGYRSSE